MDSIADDVNPPDFDDLPWGVLGRSLTLGCVSLVGKFVLNFLNTTTVTDEENFTEAVLHRPENVGLITVSNHASTFDDPMLHAALLPASFFFTEHRHSGTRWVACAEEICFRNEFLRQFFVSGKTLPLRRGAGVHQPAMSKLAALVRRGDWIHVFPEGRIVYSGEVGKCRWGIGKLICDATSRDGAGPIVLPFYHSGMSRVMPRRARIPRMHQSVTVTIGMPLDLRHLTCHCHDGTNEEEVWVSITNEIENALNKLRMKSRLFDKTP